MDKKVVIVGLGMGRHHARLVNETPGLHLYGICDINAVRREDAKRVWPHVKMYSRFDRVLADEAVHLVSLVVPHNQHCKMAIQAMRAGKNVVLDKPMCLSVPEARAMLRARDQAKVLLSVFQNRRWDDDFLTVQRAVEAGLIGNILHFESNIAWHGQFGGWRTKRRAMGGWMFDWGAHLLDQLCLLVKSKPRSVFAVQHWNPEYQHEVEDFIRALIRFEDGTSACITVSAMGRLPMPRFCLFGTEGMLVYREGEPDPCRIGRKVNGMEVRLMPPVVKGQWQSFYGNISGALARREKLIVRPDELLPSLAIAHAAHLSAAKGREVRIREVARL